MAQISPKVAAEMAAEIYAVQNEMLLKLFLSRPEFSGVSTNKRVLDAEVGFRLINTTDGFGVCARGGKGFENSLFLVFRGSTTANYMADWASNFRIGVEHSVTGLPVHIGFNQIFSSMYSDIKGFVENNLDNVVNIYCIGHSLGGAVATLAADWARSYTKRDVSLYTFGAPKAGFEHFAREMTNKLKPGNIHRVFHATDPVPMIPLYPFTHVPAPGAGHYVESSEGLLSAAAHDILKYRDNVKGMTWAALSGPLHTMKTDKEVELWLKSDKPLNPLSPKTWDWINAGLIIVLKKIMHGAAIVLQSSLVAGFTLADKIAWLLRKGIDLSKSASEWVFSLMRKIMQALGMAVARTIEELTQAFMEKILNKLMTRINEEGKRAIRHITIRKY